MSFTEATAAHAASICDALTAVAAKATAMEQMADKPVTASSWQARIMLPGFDRCTISRYEGAYTYTCETTYPDAAAALTAAKGIGRGIRDQCQGSVALSSDTLDTAGVATQQFYTTMLSTGAVGDGLFMLSTGGKAVVRGAGEVGTEHVASLSIFARRPAHTAAARAEAPAEPVVVRPFEVDAKLFCTGLKRLDLEAKTGFSAILGAKEGSTYKTRYILAGAQRCYIGEYDPTDRYHSCRMYEAPDRAAAERAMVKLEGLTKSCLGQGLTYARKDRGEGAYRLTGTRAGEPAPEISLHLRHSDDWSVSLDIEQLQK